MCLRRYVDVGHYRAGMDAGLFRRLLFYADAAPTATGPAVTLRAQFAGVKSKCCAVTPTGWFAGNPVAANLLMLLIFIGGFNTLQQTDREAYPRFAPERIGISALYPGAGPAEIQQSTADTQGKLPYAPT